MADVAPAWDRGRLVVSSRAGVRAGAAWAVLVLLGLMWVSAPLVAAHEGHQHEGSRFDPEVFGQRFVYLEVDATERAASWLQRFVVASDAEANGLRYPADLGLPVPAGSTTLDVFDASGARVSWVVEDEVTLRVRLVEPTAFVEMRGSLAVTGAGTLVVDHGRHSALVDGAGSTGAAGAVLVVAAPESWDGSPHVSDAETVRAVAEASGFPAAWPVLWDAQVVGVVASTPDGLPRVQTFGAVSAAGHAPWVAFAVMGVGLVVATYVLFRLVHAGLADPTRANPRMGVLGHLEELRRRLGIVLATLGGATLVFFVFRFEWWLVPGLAYQSVQVGLPVPVFDLFDNAASDVYAFLARAIVPPGVEIIVTGPLDAAVTQMGIALMMGFVTTFPVLFYQLYAFLAPGLYARERRAVLRAVPLVSVLFAAGALFGLLVMAPFMTGILYRYADPLGARAFLAVAQLVSVALLTSVMFGIAFQLPAVMALLTRIGLTRTTTWVRGWRVAVFVIALVAALVTDPTLLSQLVVAAVLLVLYGLGIGLSSLMERRADLDADATRHA